jgi:hypothetical protein
MPPVTVCRVCGLTVMEVTRNVPLLQVRQVEAYVKNEGRRWEASRAALSFFARLALKTTCNTRA